jgi:hypothetical protein
MKLLAMKLLYTSNLKIISKGARSAPRKASMFILIEPPLMYKMPYEHG